MKKYVVLVGLLLLVFFVGSAVADEIDALIKQLTKSNPAQRLAAAKALGERKDPRAVIPLVTVLKKDTNWDVRLAAEDALVSIGSPSVEPLVQLLKEEKSCFVRRRSVRAVKEIKDPCAAEGLLKAAATDVDCCVRRFAARGLADINDPKATEFLDEAMIKKNLEIISGAYPYYIRKGVPGTEDVLVETLKKCFYNRKMVLDFAFCGNEKLKQAADEIAKKRGYTIASDWSGPKWGTI
jgi:HEAT repeat protein